MDIQISMSAARVNANLSQKEMAEKLGVSKATVGCWERGVTVPRVDQFQAFCDICKIPRQCIILPRTSI